MHFLITLQLKKPKLFEFYFPFSIITLLKKSYKFSTAKETIGGALNPNLNAHQLFDNIPEPNVVSCSTLIRQLGKQNRHKEAIGCLLRMLRENIRPNDYTFSSVFHSSTVLQDLHFGRQVHSFALKTSFNSNVFVGSAILDLYVKASEIDNALRAFLDTESPNVVSYSTLISGYIKEGNFGDAMGLFNSMPERNTISWNAMISGSSQTGNNEMAVKFLVEMLREGVMPSEFTFPCAMIAAANIGALNIGKSIHACAVKFLGKVNFIIANSFISFYAKCGSMEDSLLIFNKMDEKSLVSWNALICGYAQNGEGYNAVRLFARMKCLGVKPNSVTILGLLMACNHAGLVEEGYKCLNDFPSLVKAEHYACMIDLLSRLGRFKEVEKFLGELNFDLGVGFWKAVLGGCRVHSNLELGEYAAKKIIELDPADVSSYIMLSNAHLAAGRLMDVVKVRGIMREKGLKRISGSSWIEVESKVHVFVAGDKRHCDVDEIYKALNYLIDHLRDIKGSQPFELSFVDTSPGF